MNVDEIIAKARAATGLEDIGDPTALEGLEALVKSSNEDGRFSEVGTQRWETYIVDMLINRLRVVDHLKKNPQLLERPVDRPMFVFGPPRTGTTLTINLLNADPARRCMLRWESFAPAPPAAPGALRTDPRFFAEKERVAMQTKYVPHIAAAHYEDADHPGECQYAMAMSFCAQIYDSLADLPGYRDWFYNTDYLPAFRFHKQLLQVLQQHNGGRWTLKNPWHPLFLNEMTTVYPDAQLVMTHRDPAEVVGSLCSLIRHLRPIYSDVIDLRAIARQMIEGIDLMIERQNQFRDLRGDDAIFDIHYEEQLRDPIGQMRKLYAHFDEPFSAEAEAGMRKALSENPQYKFGKHVYALAEFGLDAAEVRYHFRDYCDRFGIPLKGPVTRTPLAPTIQRQADRIRALTPGADPAPTPVVADAGTTPPVRKDN